MAFAKFELQTQNSGKIRLTEDCEIGIQVALDNLMENQLIGDSISERQISMSARCTKKLYQFRTFSSRFLVAPRDP